MRTKLILPGILIVALGLGACGGTNNRGNALESKQQSIDTYALELAQPLPHYNFSQIRQNLIELETAQANGVQTTSFFFNQGVANPIQTCPSIGAPIPTTTQLSNPLEQVRDPNGGNVPHSSVLGQMDPNGVYSGPSSGTYVMCVAPNGKAYADYWEGFVQTVFGPAHWDSAQHQVVLDGPPSFKFTK